MVNSISTYSRGKVFHASYKLNFPGILLLLFLLMPSMVFSQFEGTQLNNLPAIGTGSAAYHTIYIDKNGKLYTWGDNKDGQLGDGTNTDTNVPVAVKMDGVLAGKKIAQVAAGFDNSIALADDGSVFTWGDNESGQLGDGSNTNTNVPVAVKMDGALTGKKITQVATGLTHSIAFADDGTVFTWGSNSAGQLGNGTNNNSNVPVAVKMDGALTGKKITQVATGDFLSIAVADDGTVFTWGDNKDGQLGDGTNTDTNVPVAVKMDGVLTGKKITQVTAGDFYSIALADDGTVYAWGNNLHGQLGDGTNTDTNVPVAVKMDGVLAGKIITQVAAGNSHSIAVADDGTVYTWGDNFKGQLGDGTDFGTNAYVPVAVKTDGVLAGKKITRAAAGVYHSIVLADDGTVSAWGLNVHGQLGDGTNTDTNVPVASATTITSIESNNDSELPTNFTLEQNYPNPFNPSTTIRFSIPNTGNVSLKIYDLLGQEILTLVNEQLSAGSYNVNFNAGELTSGIYFYRIETGSFTATKKLMLVK